MPQTHTHTHTHTQSEDDGWKPGDAIPPRLDDLNLIQRERVLRYMVMRMADLPLAPKKVFLFFLFFFFVCPAIHGHAWPTCLSRPKRGFFFSCERVLRHMALADVPLLPDPAHTHTHTHTPPLSPPPPRPPFPPSLPPSPLPSPPLSLQATGGVAAMSLGQAAQSTPRGIHTHAHTHTLSRAINASRNAHTHTHTQPRNQRL